LNSRFPLLEVGTVESTMVEAARLVSSGVFEDWTTILAGHQTGGRGRSGRAWINAPGDAFLATVIARVAIPPERAGLIAIAAGVSVAEVLAQLGVDVRLKWPNDILVDERKLGGILIQTQLTSPLIALIGVGINLRGLPSGVSDAVSIEYLGVSPPPPADLARPIVARLQVSVRALEAGGWKQVTSEWTKRALWLGQPVSLIAEREIPGILEGIDEFGRLLLRAEEGAVLFTQAEIQRGPRRKA
jgi:BirA family biotin operon repressor/biotin-[acetyl-CoA-carboxylase] ligase